MGWKELFPLGDTSNEGEMLFPPFEAGPLIIGFLAKLTLLGDLSKDKILH